MTTRAEWRGREAFAEVAETLGIPTDHIIAAWDNERGLGAMFTMDVENRDAQILAASFTRDADGVLRSEGIAPTGDTVDDLFKRAGLT